MIVSYLFRSPNSAVYRFSRRWLGDVPPGCGWEYVIRKAECRREADKLDNAEELGVCVPQAEKPIDAPCGDEDLSPVSGIPESAREINTALVRQRSKHVMQQGTANTHAFVMTFDGSVEWENPNMGWTSGSNPNRAIELIFPDLASARRYGESHGWQLHIPNPPHDLKATKMPKKNYGDNFSWNKRTRLSTK